MSKDFGHKLIQYSLFLLVFSLLAYIIYKQNEYNKQLKIGVNETQRNLQLLTAGTSIDEKRLRKVLQIEKVLSYQIPKKSQEFRHLLAITIVDAAERYKSFDHMLLVSLMAVENHKFKSDTASPAGAVGLTQFLPSTARGVCFKYRWTYTDSILFDVEKNILFGADFLDECITLGGSVELGLAMYNGWERQKNRYKLWKKKESGQTLTPEEMIESNMLSEETKNYPAKIFKKMKQFEKISTIQGVE